MLCMRQKRRKILASLITEKPYRRTTDRNKENIMHWKKVQLKWRAGRRTRCVWMVRKTLAQLLWRCASVVYWVKCTGTALSAKCQTKWGSDTRDVLLLTLDSLLCRTWKKDKEREREGGGGQSPTGHTFLICVHHKGLAISARAEP